MRYLNNHLLLIFSMFASMAATSAHATGTAKVGTPRGTFAVSPLGGATYSVAIDCPPGIGGLEPRVSIDYNSQAGNGLAGWGCNIGGMSAITLSPKDIYHDGHAYGIHHDLHDAFVLDGRRLIELERVAGRDTAVYCPEGDPYTRVVLHGLSSVNQTSTWFSVASPDGMKYEYGLLEGKQSYYSPSMSQGVINAWYLTKAESPAGNAIDYHYTSNGNFLYPDYVQYGSYGYYSYLRFEYEQRPDTAFFFLEGSQGSMARRLKTVTTSSQVGGTEQVFRRYRLLYNDTGDGSTTKYSRLASVTAENGSGEAMNPIQFGWQNLAAFTCQKTTPTFQPSLFFEGALANETSLFAADLNGDGLADIAQYAKTHVNGSSNNFIRIYYASVNSSGAVSFPSASQIPLGESYAGMGWSIFNMSPAAADIDGDGINELLVPQFFNQSDEVRRFVLYAYKGNTEFLDVVYPDMHVTDADNILWCPADFNNDGKCEFVILEKATASSSLYYGGIVGCSSSSTDYCKQFRFSLTQVPQSIQTADMNQDGLTDIVVFYQNGYSVFINDGSWLDNLQQTTPVQPSPSAHIDSLKHARVWQGDFNGDGIPDFLVLTSDTSDLFFLLGKGDGTLTKKVAATTEIFEQTTTERDDDRISCQVTDLDGDGKTDAVITKSMYRSRPFGGHEHRLTYTYWFRSDGKLLVLKKMATSVNSDDGLAAHYLSGDFNGDGMAEIASLSYDCYSGTNANESPVFRIYRNGNYTVGAGKASIITDGLFRQTAITYKPMTDPTVYTKGTATSEYPVIAVTTNSPVVAVVNEGNGAGGAINKTYQYEGLNIHLQGKGLLGMTANKETTNGDSTIVRVLERHPASFMPSVVRTSQYLGADVSTSEVKTTFTFCPGTQEYVISSDSTTHYDFDGNCTTEYSFFLPSCGKPLTVFRTYNDGILEKTYYTYGLYGGQDLPLTVEQWKNNNYITQTTYSYNSKGLPTQMVQNDSTQLALTTSYSYDSWGNLVGSTTTGQGMETVTQTWQYDGSHRFVTHSTERGYIVKDYTYDPWGNILTETDNTQSAHPLTTTNVYDGWGTLQQSTSPEGVTTTYTTGWGNSAMHRYYTMESTPGQPWVRKWYDNSGHNVSTKTVGASGMADSCWVAINWLGQAVHSEQWEGSRYQMVNNAYDTRHRLLSSFPLTGDSVSYAYAGRSVTTTSAGRSRTTVSDSQGNIVTATDPLSSVSYTYAPCGKPSSVTSEGATVSMGYDDAGNQTSLSDPDAGTSTYAYDPLGRVTSQTDGNGITTTNTYNSRGQLSQQQMGSNSPVAYTYGQSTDNNGLLLSATHGSCTSSYEYDSFRRVSSETRTLPGGTTFNFTYAYDSQGHLSQTVYPGNLTVGYTYDSHGFLTAMTVGNQQVWRLEDANGLRDSVLLLGTCKHVERRNTLGQPVKHTWSWTSNDFEDNYTFDSQTGNLLGRSSHFSIQMAPFDPIVGSLGGESTLGGVPGGGIVYPPVWPVPYGMLFSESYTYDALDRLTSVRCYGNHLIDTITYAANGNILSRTAIGGYGYDDEAKPHAVVSVANTQGTIPQTTLLTSFGDFGKVDTLTLGNWQTAIDYGPDGERWRSVTKQNGTVKRTILYAGDVEQVTEGGTTRTFYYLGHGIIVVKQGDTVTPYVAITDHLGSITRLVNASGTTVFSASYDAWGKQSVGTTTVKLHRGYTGHEMLSEYGLINMNGRLYDPQLGRFLSPDNYVQQPDNSQNFNRYSYCLNNPLKYNDPSGEWLILSAVSGLIRGAVKLISGHGQWYSPFYNAYKNVANDVKIKWGLFKGSPKQILSRFTWELPQTILGYEYSNYRLVVSDIDKVRYFDGATYVINQSKSTTNGVTLGSFININTAHPIPVDSKGHFAPYNDELLAHEYGHYLQSLRYSWGYLFSHGIPSLINDVKTKGKTVGYKGIFLPEHRLYWTERDANNKANNYFQKHGYLLSWPYIKYPL